MHAFAAGHVHVLVSTTVGLFGFVDYRRNAGQSLNATLDTMTEFAMDDAHSGWDADLRGFDYDTDVKGSVKVVSALHPLAASLPLLRDTLRIGAFPKSKSGPTTSGQLGFPARQLLT